MTTGADAAPARALRLGFAGTPAFARVALQALLDAGYAVELVLTQPDRPAGRGLKLQPSAVKQCALDHGLALAQPRSLRLDGSFAADARAAAALLRAAALDVLVVAAYGLILPAWVLALPRHGCLNIHGSLLPRWRGAAPIQRAIEAGDTTTGITIMQMDEGLDTGPMLRCAGVEIGAAQTTGELHDSLAALGAELLLLTLDDLAAGRLQPQPQPAAGACYAPKIAKAEGALDWSQPAAVLARRVRAFDPFPGCTADIGGQALKVWQAQALAADGAGMAAPGTLLRADGDALHVACGDGVLALQVVQQAGGRRLAVRDFLSRQPLLP